jgi:predicted small metal-binding protein
MSYTIACGDVMPGCEARFTAETKDDLLAQVAGHAKDEHGVEEITPDVLSAVNGAIQPA